MILSTALMISALTVQADPLAPARDGMVQCFMPDSARQTCAAIGSYTFGPNGAIQYNARVAAMAEPLVVFESRTAVTVRDGAECSRTLNSAADIHRVEIGGVALVGAALEQARNQIGQQLDALIGGAEMCATYQVQPDGTIQTTTTLNGVARPEFDGALIWVRPADAWPLAAATD